MFKSFNSYAEQNRIGGKLKLSKQVGFVKNHLLNVMSRYWFVYIVFGLLGVAIGASRFNVYEGDVLFGIIDFLGLARLFLSPTLNSTWWFMFVIIILYIIFPLIYKIASYSPELVLAISFAALISPIIFEEYYYVIRQFQVYQFAFIMGMYCSRYNAFERISNKLDTPLKRWIVSGLSVLATAVACLRLDINPRYKLDTVFAIALIVASFTVLSRIPILNRVLEELGKYSAVIFMSHTFIYLYYFRDFIYWFKYPVLIFIVIAIASYIAARLVELLMKLTGYNKLFAVLTRTK